jgi:DNA-binding NarL/FixJ family response regulator
MTSMRHEHGDWGLLIVEDRQLVREAMLAIFRSERGFWCDACRLEDAAVRAADLRPRVALVDGSVAPSRVAGLVEALQAAPGMAVVILDDDVPLFRLRAALEAGACGYWTRKASVAELREAMRVAESGRRTFCPRALACLEPGVGSRSCNDTETSAAGLARLTNRELQVLRFLAEGLTVKECARRLELAHSTADNHKARLMKKLGVHRLAELVRLAVREGLVER